MVSKAALAVRARKGLAPRIAGLLAAAALSAGARAPATALAAQEAQVVGDLAAFNVLTDSAAPIARADAQEAASDALALDTGTLLLCYDPAAVAGVGTQVSTGHTSCCLAFCQAIGDSMLTGSAISHTEYAYYGDCASNPCASYDGWEDDTTDLADVIFEIDAGRPAVVHVAGYASSSHWVVAYGYQGVADPDEATLDNLLVIDPWDGALLVASDRYSRHGDGVIRLSTSGGSVTPSNGLGVYRLYNEVTSEHLYTADFNEYASLVVSGADWRGEGTCWTGAKDGVAVYRLYNSGLGLHHYTSDLYEMEVLVGQEGWVPDNDGLPIFYSAEDAWGNAAEGASTVYRLYNPALGQHHLTRDENEYATLALEQYGWNQEGKAFYALG